ncbi:unnamed protein product [Owenia fusiformis]|uniref:Cytochrome P450 n=1 Tax=Owenia fusiformis TaxID=6347 RepID=A0A8J1T7H2_OWEFU|nr:unnamed protein product [Owenia fusiformis]
MGLVVTFISWCWPAILLMVIMKLWTIYNDSKMDQTSPLPLPRGSYGLPIIGETIAFVTQFLFDETRLQKYGNVFKTHVLGEPTIICMGPENVRKVLSGEHRVVTSSWPSAIKRLFGEGALSQSFGGIHRKRQKLVRKAFTHDALKSYVTPIRDLVRKHVTYWCDGENEVQAKSKLKSMLLEIACKVVLGLEYEKSDYSKIVETYETFSNGFFAPPINIPGSVFYKAMQARKTLHKYAQESMDRKTNDDRIDALQYIQSSIGENGEALSEEEIRESVIELMFSGHETTASACTSVVMLLARHPDVIGKIRDELDRYGMFEEDGYDVDLDDINRLQYVGQVMKEVLRLAPPTGGGFRKVLETFELEGCQIPKGWTIIYNISNTHRLSNHFDNISDFDPDRWHPDSMTKNQSFHYLPFGGGARSCVGKEFAKLLIKILIVEMARSCSWTVKQLYPRMSRLPVLNPVDGLPTSFKRYGKEKQGVCCQDGIALLKEENLRGI